MKTLAFCLLLIAGGLWFGWARHAQVVELRRTHDELRQAAAEAEQCKQESARAAEPSPDAAELARLRAEWSELMKLRSEIGRLRQAARLDLPVVQQQVQAAVEQAAKEELTGRALLEQRASALHSDLAGQFLEYSLLNPLIRLAKANGGRFPGSFAEAETMVDAAPESERWMLKHVLSQSIEINPSEADLIGRSFSVSARDFEFVPGAAQLTVADPPALLLREVAPRQLPDGQFARWYAFTDGRKEEIKSRDDRSFPDPNPIIGQSQNGRAGIGGPR